MATETPLANSPDNKVDYEGDAVMASARSNSDTARKSTPQSPPNTHTPRKSGVFFGFFFFYRLATFNSEQHLKPGFSRGSTG